MINKFFNWLQFQYFFWRYTDGSFLDEKQKKMFYAVENNAQETFELDCKDGIMIFMASYAAWKSSKGFMVAYATSCHGKRFYYSNLYNLPNHINANGVYVDIQGGNCDQFRGLKFDYFLVDNQNITDKALLNVKTNKLIRFLSR